MMLSPDIWELNQPATEAAIEALERKWSHRLPPEYLDLLKITDGASSVLVQLWPTDEVLEDGYRAHEFGPHLVFFGSDGCGELFAFDSREPLGSITMVHAISNWTKDTKVVAKTFDQFVRRAERLATEEGYSLLDPID